MPYVYCVDNPLRYTDPLGEIPAAAIPAAVKGLIITGTITLAIFFVSPYGQALLGRLGQAIGVTFQGFVSTAENASVQVEEAVAYFQQISCNLVTHVQSIVNEAVQTKAHEKKQSEDWSKNTVYVHYGTENGEVYYVGRTNNFARRFAEHAHINFLGVHTSKHPIGPDVGRYMVPVVTGLDYLDSRIVEELLILAFTLDALENARHEISEGNMDKMAEEVGRVRELLEIFY